MQGGEFPAVVVAMAPGHAHMLERALVYTAVTRARRVCAIVGDPQTLRRACRTARADARRTTLPGAIRRELAQTSPLDPGAPPS
jgi:exodeoxyribonuclease V alpha subunit